MREILNRDLIVTETEDNQIFIEIVIEKRGL